ncbi:lamin tail domain-containing protein [Chryseobacterium sp. PMSZPI]|uniref:lamin tail domain-containing protein n=1 Tax=Chryseobacterium sp. PMSZPI TaxID=1033900 RepID=UPI000C33E588|nr:lamin tail domain-containing protein [Chryseobacterium sp. PMSZPI]PKF74594.1 hypothetical protein CW752_08510 [Chryseobacterium sp. PMSZPI]
MENLLKFPMISGDHDVEIMADNTANFTSSGLELHGKIGNITQETFIRFEEITLPPDAEIINAYLEFSGRDNSTVGSVITIRGEIGNSSPYPASTAPTTGANLKARKYTEKNAVWTTDKVVASQKYTSPDLKDVLKEMLPDSVSKAKLSFRITGNGQGTFTMHSFNGNQGLAPTLYIKYSSKVNVSKTPVSTGSDDAREKTTGEMTLTYNNLDLGGRPDVKNNAFRFQNIQIPKDGEITDAYLEFYAYGVSSASNIEIYLEIGNAATYSTNTKDITSRKYNSQKVIWQAAATTKDRMPLRTPNLKALIVENLWRGWESGNSLAFKLVGLSSNSGTKVCSFEINDTNYIPKLIIESLQADGDSKKIDGIYDPALMTELYINEIAPQGTTDESRDWVELYNDHDQPLYIREGVYLSNKKNNKTLYEIKNTVIPAKGYAIFIADKTPELGDDQLNFKIDNSGGTLFLSRSANGKIVEQDKVTYPEIPFNQTYGRLTDGKGEFAIFINSTYKTSNEKGFLRLETSVSHTRGVYPTGFELSIMAPEGSTIKYTLDGSFPSEKTGTIYTKPISIQKTTVVKYYVFDAKGNNSGVIAHSYILQDNYKNENFQYKANITSEEYAQGLLQIPIISISALNSSPYLHFQAVVPPTYQRVSFEYIDSNINPGNKNFYSNAGIRPFGQESIAFTANQGLKFKFNKDWEVKKANYNFFDPIENDPNPPSNKINSLELKEGQDGPSRMVFNTGIMRYSEKIVMNLKKEMGKYALCTKYIHLFINGKYKGVRTMRDDFNEQNIEEYFCDDGKNYTKINFQDGGMYIYGPAPGAVKDGDGELWRKIKKAAVTDKNLQAFKELVDLDDLIKYQLMNMITDNEYEAVAIVHNLAPQFMKAKFIINDTDGSFFGGYAYSTSEKTLPPIGFFGGGGNYKFKWDNYTVALAGPGQLFGSFIGTKTDPKTGNLEFKTLVKDAVLKYIGPASGDFQGKEGAPLSVKNIQKHMINNVKELDLVYKIDAAYLGYRNIPKVYDDWKNIDHPRILTQVSERVEYNLKKWLEYNLAHTFSAPTIQTEFKITEKNTISIINPNDKNSKIYYTIDGSDPMGKDGSISPSAQLYTSKFSLSEGDYTITSRAFSPNNWGPIASKSVKVISDKKGKFVISGINYKPEVNADAEFLLITNAGAGHLDLSGYAISDAFTYTFPEGIILESGKTLMLAKNITLITGYPDLNKHQWTSGNLSNDGEPITFMDKAGAIADKVTYSKKAPWPATANGKGHYLKLIHHDLDNELPESWEAVPINS